MKCPFCDLNDTQVKDSRPSLDNLSIRRRRFCPSCGGKFKTMERIETKELRVLKKNGEKRDFDPNKLINSIEVATRKRKLPAEAIETIVNSIIKKLDQYGEGEIETKILGEMVMQKLAELDHVAYIRYASVYKDFADSSDFAKCIEKLHHDHKHNDDPHTKK